MAEQLKLYPSGFLGSASVVQTKPLDVVTAARQFINKGAVSEVSRFTANADVVDIWMDMGSGTPEFKTFEFKERILRCALSAFGTDSALAWVDSQASSPEFTDNHLRWIDETLRYVIRGRARELSSNNWKTLLRVGGVKTPRSIRSPEVINAFIPAWTLGLNGIAADSFNTIPSFIAQWVRRPGGIVDLMNSLEILFGKR